MEELVHYLQMTMSPTPEERKYDTHTPHKFIHDDAMLSIVSRHV